MLQKAITTRILLCLTVLALLASPCLAELPEQPGLVTAVTIYQDKALVSRQIVLATDGGDMEFLVTGLPAHIISSSLYATSDTGQIQGVTFFVDETVEAAPALDVPKQLVLAVGELELTGRLIAQKLITLAQEEQYLLTLQNTSTSLPSMFTATTRGDEDQAAQVNFDPDQAVKLFNYIFQKRTEIGAKKIDLITQQAALSRQLTEARENIVQFHKDNPPAEAEFDRRALVRLTGLADGNVTVQLNYLVQNVKWSPTYTVRATTGDDNIRLDYNAFVYQQTGEDWTNVELTLSTASPDMWAEPPVLKPLWVELAEAGTPITGGQYSTKVTFGNISAGERDQLVGRLALQITNRQNVPTATSIGGAFLDGIESNDFQAGSENTIILQRKVTELDTAINSLGNQLQVIDLTIGDGNGRAAQIAPRRQSVSLEYHLSGSISIPSRPEQMMVKVDELALAGKVTYVAVPLLTSQVFREAELTNTSELALLPGPVSTYLDDRFVGAAALSFVSQGEMFGLGFGVDSQLEAHRELVERTEGESWGKTKLTFEYRITLTNYKDENVTVLVKDRLVNLEDTEIKLVSLESSDELDTDEYYTEYLKPLGLLRWTLDVPARAQRADVDELTYTFALEFDKDYHIVLPSVAAAQELEDKAIYDSAQPNRSIRW